MADYVFSPQPTTAVDGVNDAVAFQPQAQNTNNLTVSNGTVSVGNLNLGADYPAGTKPGWLTGRRPVKGQLFPRGVYNK